MTPDTFIENSYYSALHRSLDQYWEDRLQNEYQPKNDFNLGHDGLNKWTLFLPEPVTLSKREIAIYLNQEHDIRALLLEDQAIALSLFLPCNDFDDHNHLLRACDLLLDYQKAQLELTTARIEAHMALVNYRLLRQQVKRKFYSTALPGRVAREPILPIYVPQHCA
ncbi:hypothetical protein [Haliscomenobacter hydrossis]|uniref:Uncharacterized protein n=1 Tax=Haliscomenobacter hydrossis (strain ATCC 27775 / DSM 1100 / LMG 10767 / O) TaxID=760192 RepID=F4L7Q4_HALH1|nr:hypothetical protein [Haliscomenobacter hydrossis]AEE54412.1 hypothetical protein Halhy_6596 [Haliscomenobacter hydrossis DSM 1100]